ncbi:MAG TPA: methionine--tRNA ligase [Thermoanaerobaculia bacterium]|nr:methionine--tRNA ligase [Thermoanaerobaculia bacterium]
MPQKFYITTAIHYVNDVPHIGHMYENIVADVIARHRRRMGDEVWFLTGTDEHGQRIERAAARQGILPIELANRVVADHHRLWKKLNISYDDFIRTTEARHRVGVHEIIRRMLERNPDDIYLGEFQGWYCPNDETYFTDKEVTDARCPNGHPLERAREQNYFFRLSRYGKLLLDFYKGSPGFVQPQTRLNEVIAFVESGLKDLSVSRTSIRWGVPWPGNPDHVIYVWLDALTNYISALGFGSADDAKFRRYWPADLHLIGKDIIRFHAVYWPAFLMSAGIDLPKRVFAHGWWLRDNQKISKSVGNIVRPENIVDDFGADPFRYFVLREMVFGQDQNYSDEAFVARYNADLANDLGNTMSRALKMSETYFGGKTPPTPCDDNDLLRASRELVPEYLRGMEAYAFQRALENTWRLLVAINGYIVAKEPWKQFKDRGADATLSRVIWNTLESLRIVWVMLAPFMPTLSRDALTRLGSDADAIGRDALQWGRLPNNVPIRVGESLFPRIDSAAYLGGSMSNPPIETTQAAPADLAKISIEQFMEIDLRVADIRAAEKVEKSKKLIKLTVFDGERERILVAGIATRYAPEELVGRKVVIVANLQSAKLMGIESNGMVLAASIGGEPSLLSVDAGVPAGTKVK